MCLHWIVTIMYSELFYKIIAPTEVKIIIVAVILAAIMDLVHRLSKYRPGFNRFVHRLCRKRQKNYQTVGKNPPF